jgi:hypothetical protein
MGKRFAIVIGVAAAGVMALGAQPAAAVPTYDTRVTLTHLENDRFYHGRVFSDVAECERKRRVVLFKKRPGADRKLGKDRSFYLQNTSLPQEWAQWWISGGPEGRPVYVKVRSKERDQFVCRADRSRSWTYE